MIDTFLSQTTVKFFYSILQAVQTKKVTNSMSGVVKAMDSAMKSMNLEKISNLMDRFEKDFEDLDVQTSVMEGAMNQTTATNVPQDSVENLMKQAADEAGLELNMDLPSAANNTIGKSNFKFKISILEGDYFKLS